MISSVTGLLQHVDSSGMVVICQGIGYEILLPMYLKPYYAAKLGENVTVYTQCYIQGNPATGNMVPVLVGFSKPEEREFFAHLLTVEGIGVRAALRILAVPPSVVARSVEIGDVKTLSSLPGLGKQKAAQMIAKLRGKLGAYAEEFPAESERGDASLQAPNARGVEEKPIGLFDECLQVMLQLGYRRSEAEDMVRQVLETNHEVRAVEDFIRAAFRKSELSEG